MALTWCQYKSAENREGNSCTTYLRRCKIKIRMFGATIHHRECVSDRDWFLSLYFQIQHEQTSPIIFPTLTHSFQFLETSCLTRSGPASHSRRFLRTNRDSNLCPRRRAVALEAASPECCRGRCKRGLARSGSARARTRDRRPPPKTTTSGTNLVCQDHS